MSKKDNSEHILVMSAQGSETRVGMLENGELVEYFVEREQERGLSGNIYRGKVNRVLPGMQAAFIDLGPTVERKAYLYVAEVKGAGDEGRLFHGTDGGEKKGRGKKRSGGKRIENLLKENQEVTVQITKEPVGEKGARVTGYISLPGRHSVLMPGVDKVGVSRRIASSDERKRLRAAVDSVRPKGAGVIVRTAAEGAEEQEVSDDVRFIHRLSEEIASREAKAKAPSILYKELDLVLRTIRDMLRQNTREIYIDDEDQFRRATKFCETFMPTYTNRIKLYEGRQSIFDHFGIEAALRTALHRHVPLKSGGSLVVEQGEALTAIDVNTGSFVGRVDLETTITKNNMEACHAIAAQLRLRNIGGIIVIDFVDMDKSSNRQMVWEEFQKALERDKARANITKISELGLVEMTRKRSRESLKQMLAEPCPACEGRSYIKSTTTVAHEILRDIRRCGATVSADRIDIVCSPKVAELLEKFERGYIDELEKRFHKKVEVKKSSSMPPDQYKVAGRAVKDEEQTKKSGGGRRRGGSKGGKSGGKSDRSDRSERGGRESKRAQSEPAPGSDAVASSSKAAEAHPIAAKGANPDAGADAAE